MQMSYKAIFNKTTIHNKSILRHGWQPRVAEVVDIVHGVHEAAGGGRDLLLRFDGVVGVQEEHIHGATFAAAVVAVNSIHQQGQNNTQIV